MARTQADTPPTAATHKVLTGWALFADAAEGEGPIVPSHSSAASTCIIDALQYATGSRIHSVLVSGESGVQVIYKRLFGERMRTLRSIDVNPAERILHRFAAACARDSLALAEEDGLAVDPALHAAIKAKLEWNRGIISEDEFMEARRAASDAGTSPEWSSAYDAAKAATCPDAVTAAREAARDAAFFQVSRGRRTPDEARGFQAGILEYMAEQWFVLDSMYAKKV